MKSNTVFLRHILDEINFLLRETKGINYEEFLRNETLKRASTRSLEIIGEASKNLSPDFRKKYKKIQWKKLSGMRDKIIHFYWGVNWDIVWDAIKERLPGLQSQIENILSETGNTNGS